MFLMSLWFMTKRNQFSNIRIEKGDQVRLNESIYYVQIQLIVVTNNN